MTIDCLRAALWRSRVPTKAAAGGGRAACYLVASRVATLIRTKSAPIIVSVARSNWVSCRALVDRVRVTLVYPDFAKVPKAMLHGALFSVLVGAK